MSREVKNFPPTLLNMFVTLFSLVICDIYIVNGYRMTGPYRPCLGTFFCISIIVPCSLGELFPPMHGRMGLGNGCSIPFNTVSLLGITSTFRLVLGVWSNYITNLLLVVAHVYIPNTPFCLFLVFFRTRVFIKISML